jgi:hypothetical protein
MDTDTIDYIREARELMDGYSDTKDSDSGPVANDAMRAVLLLDQAIAEEESRRRTLAGVVAQINETTPLITKMQAAAEFDNLYPRPLMYPFIHSEGMERRHFKRRADDRIPKNIGWTFAVHSFTLLVLGACAGAFGTLFLLYWRAGW